MAARLPFGMPRFGRPLARPGAGRIPVTVVTGFLGAGKTTLIRAALAHPAFARTAVIVNEFGAEAVDDALLRTTGETVALIGNGCICCAARNDLHRALRDLFAGREAGTVPPFDRVMVETSGLSDPGPILQSLASDRTIALHYALEGLVSVVDGALAAATDAPEWEAQVVLADRLVVSKRDIADPAALARLDARLGRLNPRAGTLDAAALRTDPQPLIGIASPRGALRCSAGAETIAPGAGGYESFVLSFAEPLPWELFERVMDTLAALRGPDLLRVKGFVAVAGSAGPVVVHQVQHLRAPAEELTRWPDDDRRTRLVFITRALGRGEVEALFAAHLALVCDLRAEVQHLPAA